MVRSCQGVLIVVAEPVPPALPEPVGEVAAGPGLAPGPQVLAGVAGHRSQCAVAGGGEVGSEQVRHQRRPDGPGGRVARIAGVTGGQDRLRPAAGLGRRRRRQALAQDGLSEPVQLHATVIDPGQPMPGQPGQGLPPGQSIGCLLRQRRRQLRRRCGEHAAGDGLRCEECAQTR